MPKGIRKVSPALKTGILDTRDLAPAEIKTSAVADKDHLVTSRVLLPATEDVVLSSSEQLDRDYLNELKFNEEIVEITIAEDTSEHPIDPVFVSCQGKERFIYRGVPTKIQRKFVECLCSPMVRINTKQTKNNLGEDATTLEQTRARQFPFQLSDPNPRGKDWLRGLLTRG